MTECLCPSCSETPSEKYSDQWKTETEARMILSMPIEGRRKYLSRLKGERRKILESEIKRQWAESRNIPISHKGDTT
jgi:hypothetical protein